MDQTHLDQNDQINNAKESNFCTLLVLGIQRCVTIGWKTSVVAEARHTLKTGPENDLKTWLQRCLVPVLWPGYRFCNNRCRFCKCLVLYCLINYTVSLERIYKDLYNATSHCYYTHPVHVFNLG